MKKSFSSKIDHLDKLKLNHLTVSETILKKFKEENDTLFNQRFIVRVNDQVEWRAGTVALGDCNAYITISKARMKTLKVDIGDTVEVTLEKDESEYGLEVPVEFTTALEQDLIASERFLQLPKGTRRNIIYLVLQFKSVDKRIEKSLFYLENLKRSPLGKTTMRHILGKE